MKTDPRLPLCKLYPAIVRQTATQGSLARGCDISGLYLRTAHKLTRATRGESWSPDCGGRGSKGYIFGKLFPGLLGQGQHWQTNLLCLAWRRNGESSVLFPVGFSFDPFFQIRPADPQICLDLSSLKLLSIPVRPHSNTRSTTWVFSQS